MKNQFIWFLGVALANLLLFIGVFTLLQKESVYERTLGRVSQNYERVGGWDNYEIKKVSKPFVKLDEDLFTHWDAGIFKCVSERMYKIELDCYGNVRAAFFPLLPMVWRVMDASPISISLLNYFLFSVSVALLVFFLSKDTFKNNIVLFSLLLCLPATISFYIPYSEALFLFTMTLLAIGLLKKKYWLYFIGAVLMALVRPATVFVLFGILWVELVYFSGNKHIKRFVGAAFRKGLPFAAGYLIAVCIQYASSGSWNALLEAREYWKMNGSFTQGFSDWSVEGFGLSIFTLFCVSLPVIIFLGYTAWTFFKSKSEFAHNIKDNRATYLFFVSMLYIFGITVFNLNRQGLDLHSFSRYILASPPFYIVVILTYNAIHKTTLKWFVGAFIGTCLLLYLVLNNVQYGGNKMDFSFFGLYLFLMVSFFLLISKFLPKTLQTVMVIVLVVLSTVWNTYLLNAFLSNAWIFT